MLCGLIVSSNGLTGGISEFVLLVIGTCSVLYPFFLCRLLGAGDIKLLAVCMGVLGAYGGLRMIFCGFLLALIHGVWKSLRTGSFRGQSVHLAIYLFAGYAVYLIGR
ncbi:MAG: hypothetical protein IJO55_09970 [Lachnospiraceae bacterium]|nr:hypothetical protein [Lachnospiraceae bacterium]MBQ6855632.1 hypothetical protein [Lachnospiraceae bacterium]